MKVFSVYLIIVLVSCSAQRRITRIINKHPELSNTIDSIVIKEYETFDTQTFVNEIDSLVIENQSVTTKIFRYYDTLRVEQDIKPDTIVKYVTKIQPYKKELKRSKQWLWALGLALVFIILVAVKR
tara:strand:- start:256 stop:633 length:378 start_codon:yes stop_codon:yes gene_type:complete